MLYTLFQVAVVIIGGYIAVTYVLWPLCLLLGFLFRSDSKKPPRPAHSSLYLSLAIILIVGVFLVLSRI
jgi:hypothetical protein